MVLPTALRVRVIRVEPSWTSQSRSRPLSIFTVIRDGPGHAMSIGAWIARCRSLPQYRGHDCDGATSDHIVHAPSGLRCQTDSYFGPTDECIFRMASTCPEANGSPITP